MTKQDKVVVNLKDGLANVIIGGRKIVVARQNEDRLDFLCPVDLISASLGS